MEYGGGEQLKINSLSSFAMAPSRRGQTPFHSHHSPQPLFGAQINQISNIFVLCSKIKLLRIKIYVTLYYPNQPNIQYNKDLRGYEQQSIIY